MKLLNIICLTILSLISMSAFASDNKILNVYAWANEIPDIIIRQFEKETGIKVNFSTFESNEILYAKLLAVRNAGYDVIMPSSYFVGRMRRQEMLEPLDKTKIPNLQYLEPIFKHPSYDPQGKYSVPYLWGITGIFVNKDYYQPNSIKKWNDLWDEKFANQLMMLDDSREVFSMALLSLGYSANDRNPEHIKEAFLKLKKLLKNIKVFTIETVLAIMIDEDATIGMAWTGDTFKASLENKNVQFIFPQDGFVIWVDNFAIPKNAAHKEEAYAFINFLLRPDIEKEAAMLTHFPITSEAGQKLLPQEVRNNHTIYPTEEILKRGQFQTDLDEETLALYEKYWEELKMGLN